MSRPKVSGVILAGGRSSRLGFDKPLIPFHGRPLIARVVDTMDGIVDECIIVTNTPDKLAGVVEGVRFVADAWARPAALVGIYSGLLAARYQHALVVACDMPFLSIPLLKYLVDIAPGCDVVMPRHQKGKEALHAVYSRQCIGPIRRLLERDEAVIVKFLPEVKVCYVDEPVLRKFDPDGLSFVNINTQGDLESARGLEWKTR
jgi:molybdopterin-guanine dinucleotide biosynthesis protein A